MEYSFFAMMARMKYIERWSLMRNSATENISEHSMEVAMIAHALAVISNEKCGGTWNPEHIAFLGLYHDVTEIITGDMPTPVKYYDDDIRNAYRRVELMASEKLLAMLPDYMRSYYEPALLPGNSPDEARAFCLVKAADKLSALIKCIEEAKAGNHEFTTARETTLASLKKMNLPEVEIFIDDFLSSYEKTLDELQ